jgi:hypothetical protein
MAKYSKKIREEAAVACAIMATLRASDINMGVILQDLAEGGAAVLAYYAFVRSEIDDELIAPGHVRIAAFYAEAEAMIREGWYP